MKRLTSIFQGKRRGPKKTPWSFVTSQLFFTSFGSDPTAQAARPRTARRPGRACGAWLSKLKRQVSKPKAISSSMGQASGAILELGQLGRAQSTLISPPVTVRVARSSTILYPASGVQGDRHIYIYYTCIYIYIHLFMWNTCRIILQCLARAWCSVAVPHCLVSAVQICMLCLIQCVSRFAAVFVVLNQVQGPLAEQFCNQARTSLESAVAQISSSCGEDVQGVHNPSKVVWLQIQCPAWRPCDEYV